MRKSEEGFWCRDWTRHGLVWESFMQLFLLFSFKSLFKVTAQLMNSAFVVELEATFSLPILGSWAFHAKCPNKASGPMQFSLRKWLWTPR